MNITGLLIHRPSLFGPFWTNAEYFTRLISWIKVRLRKTRGMHSLVGWHELTFQLAPALGGLPASLTYGTAPTHLDLSLFLALDLLKEVWAHYGGLPLILHVLSIYSFSYLRGCISLRLMLGWHWLLLPCVFGVGVHRSGNAFKRARRSNGLYFGATFLRASKSWNILARALIYKSLCLKYFCRFSILLPNIIYRIRTDFDVYSDILVLNMLKKIGGNVIGCWFSFPLT